jgi:parallel beta-helix repeat protein
MYDKGNNTYLSYKDSSGDYSLKEEELILPSYVEHLFPKAVLVGASVIDLFFKEVEKYKENPDLLEPLVADSHESIVATIKKSPKIIVLNTVNFVDDTVVGTKIVIQDTKDKIVKSVSGMASIVTNFFSAPSYVNDIDISNIATVVKAVDSPQESTEVVVIKEPVVVETKPKIEEIEILEEIVIVENKKIEEQNITEVESEIETEEDSTDIYKPKLIPVNTPFFGGGGGGSNNTPDSSTDDIVLDTEAPTVSLTSLECQNTLAVSGCLVATTTLNFSWSSEADDLGYYILDQNGAISTTTATSTALIVSNNTTYNFSVSAKDETGNTSATSTQEIEIMTSPIVINEVAWAGTTADSSDEWVELYNISTKDIDLSQWVFMAEDGVPYIPLSGIVSAGEYYLLERTDDDTVSDIQADLVAPFSGIGNGSGLSNSGEDLLLLYVDQNNATSTIDEVPSCGGWCGGLSSQKYTMERYDPYGSDWATAIGYMWNGSDASINSIIGTPKAKNSISYQIANGTSLSTDKTLTQENSPYLVTNSGFTVNAGITLTLEEGVVIKIVNPNEPQIVINGTLKTTGIASNPVVITAFADDEYGGDMNNDATSTTPTAGSWKNLTINDSSLGSSLDNTIIRYGGRWFNNMSVRASVIVDTADVSFQNVTVEHSKKHGLHLTSSASTVLNSIFKNNNTDADSAGLYVASGSPNISDNTFQDNKYGMFVSSSPDMSASSNNFIDNSIEAVHVSSSIGLFSGNTGSGNGLNAILIGDDGSITDSGSGTTTLGANSLPYLVRGSTQITASTTLAFEDGVVIKSYNNVSSYMGKIIVKDGGKLFHNSTNSDNLIFTSIHDDSVGEAVDSTITSPSAGDWYGIDVESGGMLDMSGFTVRYAGGKTAASGNDKGGIKFTGGTATSTIANALIQDNYQYGIRAFSGVSLSVSNTTIKNHTEEKQPPAAGIILFDSDLELQNMTFDNNDLDVYALGSYSLNCLENCSTANTDPIGLLP